MPLHVEQAVTAGISAELGDARQLPRPDASADVVLLLGPLYHLPDADDRRRALAEARRVLRPGGWLFAAAISRFAALLDLLVAYDRFHEPEVQPIVTDAVRIGVFTGADADLGFATAYLHQPRELAAEVAAAGFVDVRVRGIEGAASLTPDLAERWRHPEQREALLHAARLTASDPEILAVSSHLLAAARTPAAVTASP
jgi:ubiquinone/menaquinone biosynthesis C-methylase UbiE